MNASTRAIISSMSSTSIPSVTLATMVYPLLFILTGIHTGMESAISSILNRPKPGSVKEISRNISSPFLSLSYDAASSSTLSWNSSMAFSKPADEVFISSTDSPWMIPLPSSLNIPLSK